MGAINNRFARDAYREHDGRLTFNGRTLRTHGRCACGCPLLAPSERDAQKCVDCAAGRKVVR